MAEMLSELEVRVVRQGFAALSVRLLCDSHETLRQRLDAYEGPPYHPCGHRRQPNFETCYLCALQQRVKALEAFAESFDCKCAPVAVRSGIHRSDCQWKRAQAALQAGREGKEAQGE